MRGCRTEIVDVEHVYGSLGATKLFKARPGIGSISSIGLETEVT